MSTRRKRITRHKMEKTSELKAKAIALEPVVRIGKSGLTDSVIGEIKKHLEKKKMIKVKMLKSFAGARDRKELAEEIAEKTGSSVIHMVGFVVVLLKK